MLAALPDCKHLVWAGVCPGLRDGRTARHSPYLAQEPGMVLGESCPSVSGVTRAYLKRFWMAEDVQMYLYRNSFPVCSEMALADMVT